MNNNNNPKAEVKALFGMIEVAECVLNMGSGLFKDIFVIEDSQVTEVPFFSDIASPHCGKYGAFRLMGMLTIVEFTRVQVGTHFWEILTDFMGFKINHTKIANSRGIDNLGAIRQGEHFGECSCVATFVVVIGNSPYAGVGFGENGIEQCAFTHATMSRQ
jgi:hypothetical protein